MRSHSLLLLLLATWAEGRPLADRLTEALYRLSPADLDFLEKETAPPVSHDSSWEEMMADSPALPSNDTARSIKDSLDPISGRDKEQRIKNIREQVLRFLGRKDSKNSTQPNDHQARLMSIISKIKTVSPWPSADVYTELQSFYPNCEIPRNTDEEAWEKGPQMNLYFNLNFSSSGQGSTLSIQWAKLRLYKLPQGNTTLPLTEDCPGGSQGQGGVGDIADKKHYIHFPAPGSSLPIEEKQIRVSVYWYTRGLRKHRVKRKLLDSQMISYYGESWTEYNVKSAVKAWKDFGKNFGISVEVEDEDRVILSASKMFAAMNCSKDANVPQPIPSAAVDGLDNNTRHVIRATLSQLYPVIELSTREFPETEVQYSGVKIGEHKFRHHHGHPTDIPQINDTMVGTFKWEDPVRDSDSGIDR